MIEKDFSKIKTHFFLYQIFFIFFPEEIDIFDEKGSNKFPAVLSSIDNFHFFFLFLVNAIQNIYFFDFLFAMKSETEKKDRKDTKRKKQSTKKKRSTFEKKKN